MPITSNTSWGPDEAYLLSIFERSPGTAATRFFPREVLVPEVRHAFRIRVENRVFEFVTLSE